VGLLPSPNKFELAFMDTCQQIENEEAKVKQLVLEHVAEIQKIQLEHDHLLAKAREVTNKIKRNLDLLKPSAAKWYAQEKRGWQKKRKHGTSIWRRRTVKE
jgi:hypothetical protein